MKLHQLINQYIAYRKALGEKFSTNESYLKSFSKAIGEAIMVEAITPDMVNHFLYGDSKVITSSWFTKYSALSGFYRYALARHYVIEVPLPHTLPKRPQPFLPYIYSKKELKLLFDTALTYQKRKSHISPYMVRTILVLTYVLGLRLHETLTIKLNDIDIDNLVITIRESKFYKSRLVPFNEQVKEFIKTYLQWRISQNHQQHQEAFLFVSKNHQPFSASTMRGIFQRIRERSGVKRSDGANYQPRIHDLRHTFAVNRLTSWYKENKNVQQLLPILSVYLGHQHLVHTTVYLTMTDGLLQEANMRFKKYVTGE